MFVLQKINERKEKSQIHVFKHNFAQVFALPMQDA